jgi:hypothetical protein
MKTSVTRETLNKTNVKRKIRGTIQVYYMQDVKCTTYKMLQMDHIMDGLGPNCMDYAFGPQSFSIIIIHSTTI